MNFKTLAVVGLVGIGIISNGFCENSKIPITKDEAISIAKQWIQIHEPTLDITLRQPRACFYKDAFIILDGVKTTGLWTVNFGIPAPSGYSRSVISYNLNLDQWGNQMGCPTKMSP